MNPDTSNTPEGATNPMITGEAKSIISTTEVKTDFLKNTETSEKDALYADLFQQNENGEISRKQETERSYLELFTNIMAFVVPIITIAALVGAAHAYMRSQEDNAFAENYPFLCNYLNYDIDAPESEKACKTAKIIQNDFETKTAALEKNIVNQLALYIPIKLSSSAALANRELGFIKEKYEKKVNYNDILNQFEKVRQESLPRGKNNIICTTASIGENETLVTQCDVYGGAIGTSDTNSLELGSSRIEAIRFIERLSRTQESQFIVQTPPTTLSIESTENIKDIPPEFKTKTTITLSLKYVPFEPKL